MPPPANRDVGVVIAAAGVGARFGGGKTFLRLAGEPLLVHSLRAFAAVEEVAEIVVAARAEELPRATGEIERWRAAPGQGGFGSAGASPPAARVVAGGARRQDSVEQGVGALSPSCRWVLVHDAARPLIEPGDIRRLIEAVKEHGAAALGHPATDSVKEESGGLAARDLPRSHVWLVQTPQGASAELLARAYQEARRRGLEATDDAGLLAACGARVKLVEGSRSNLKVTFRLDLAVAEAILAAR